jgi:hypothetical protein
MYKTIFNNSIAIGRARKENSTWYIRARNKTYVQGFQTKREAMDFYEIWLGREEYKDKYIIDEILFGDAPSEDNSYFLQYRSLSG